MSRGNGRFDSIDYRGSKSRSKGRTPTPGSGSSEEGLQELERYNRGKSA